MSKDGKDKEDNGGKKEFMVRALLLEKAALGILVYDISR
jgi:hypothetical protein